MGLVQLYVRTLKGKLIKASEKKEIQPGLRYLPPEVPV
jgi:hypothetical protein